MNGRGYAFARETASWFIKMTTWEKEAILKQPVGSQ